MSHVAQAATVRSAAPHHLSFAQLPDAPVTDARIELPLDQVVFRRIQGAAYLQRIAHLREAIALPAGVRDAPAFVRLEKKGTSRA